MSRKRWIVPAPAMLALLLLAPAALANSNVESTPAGTNVQITVTGDAGVNVISLTGSNRAVQITDTSGATVTAGDPRCVDGGTTVTCTAGAEERFNAINTSLLDGADQVTSNTVTVSQSITGGLGADTLNGGPGFNNIDGGDEADQITGNDSGDDLKGGAGADTISGGAGSDTISGGPGDDPALVGGSGDDTLDGGTGNDGLDGGPGDDFMSNDLGSDSFAGGSGLDQMGYFNSTAPVVVTLDDAPGDGEQPGGVSEGDNVRSDIDELFGGNGSDSLTGNDQRNIISGNEGNDTINGGGGDDHLRGGTDSDTINGGGGGDVIFGADGDDILNGNAGNDSFIGDADSGSDGADQVNGDDGIDGYDPVEDSGDFELDTDEPVTISLDGQPGDGAPGEGDNIQVENLVGTPGDDVLTGGAGRNVIDAIGGNDRVSVSGDGGQNPAVIDDVTCGTGFDTVSADNEDNVAQINDSGKCEEINGRATQTQPATVVVPVPAAPDTAAPQLTIRSCAGTRRQVTCRFTTDEAVTGTAEMFAQPKGRVRLSAFNLRLASARIGSGTGSRTVRLKPSKKAIGKARRFKVRVVITVIDAGGNRTSRTKNLTIRK